MNHKIVNMDLLKVYQVKGGKKKLVTVLGWGDPIQAGDPDGDGIPVAIKSRTQMADGSIKADDLTGFVSKKARFLDPIDNDIMRFTLVDVQQGDGAVLETPKGTKVFIDGGENQMFARYLATRFPGTSEDQRLKVDAVIVTHGDADHVAGLVKVHASEKNATAYKRIFIHPGKVLHNGLVKRPNEDDPRKAFGKTVDEDGKAYITDLADDPRTLKPEEVNKNFKSWIKALDDWAKAGPFKIARLSDKTGAGELAFLNSEGLEFLVLGPLEKTLANGKPALPLLREPPKAVPGEEPEASGGGPAGTAPRYSVSHTINGNSIVLLLVYGNIRLLLTGDINEESEEELVKRHEAGGIDLTADFLKAPHHGSADFSPEFLQKIQPVVSVISSGDENERVEYIHPRATLVGALGKYGRVERPLVFITELVAFLKTMGYARLVDKNDKPEGARFFSFKRESYGVVHLSFNKQRMLVFTHSGKRDLKEAYAYTVDPGGQVRFDKLRTA
ncbi:MAG TPA: MBL fold metallo-hydrolase [Candidatus Aminicenantes bacterium]|nr:MBL fold metallo-hydrolase [Candidatus Aminicenantes bacterium]